MQLGQRPNGNAKIAKVGLKASDVPAEDDDEEVSQLRRLCFSDTSSFFHLVIALEAAC